ncbi:MAG: PLP-dependent aminotransferase family protein [Oscillospiraceae bacterium]|nr:PLP-dependent aminotransferase family protein [Oscillospiraceae bacterium]
MEYAFSDKVLGLKASAIREILKFTSEPGVISFAAGNPAPEAFPSGDIAEITADIFSRDPVGALQYSVTEGYQPLRDAVKDMLASQHCFDSERDDLVITSGGQQASELACKVFLNEGDALICESPSFVGCMNAFRSYNAELVGIPLAEDGMELDKLEDALKTHPKAKLIYVIANFQNPTGLCTSFEKRKAIYELARRYNVMILEDNPYGDIRFEGEDIPSIKSLDTDGRVIYAGSFSKVLAPGMRVGFVSAPREVINKIVVCKQCSDVHTNILAQRICYDYLSEYDLKAHLEAIRPIYRRKCRLMLDCIKESFPECVSYTRPQGGLFIWVTLPDGADMLGFCKTAVEKYKVAVVPGTAFMTHESDPCCSFRLNYSTPTDENIEKGCRILGSLLKEMFGE